MNSIIFRYQLIQNNVQQALQQANRQDTVCIVAVSKTRTANEMVAAINVGIRHFGENQLQEALVHQTQVSHLTLHDENQPLSWHFIGKIQRNKTNKIAANFDWVDSVDRKEIADRLNAQRPHKLPALNVCIQVNIDQDPNKSGIEPNEVAALAEYIHHQLPRLTLRGLMTVPQLATGSEETYHSFQRLKKIYDQLCLQGFPLDTLSMGMSGDYPEAIKAGATMIRIGTILFGQRTSNSR